jgi:hypothetical protein
MSETERTVFVSSQQFAKLCSTLLLLEADGYGPEACTTEAFRSIGMDPPRDACTIKVRSEDVGSMSGVVKPIQRCQCEACKTVQHASYCAVHNAPALPIGKCNCGARVSDERDH